MIGRYTGERSERVCMVCACVCVGLVRNERSDLFVVCACVRVCACTCTHA